MQDARDKGDLVGAGKAGRVSRNWRRPSIGRLMGSSWVIFAGLLLGLYLGLFHKDFARAIGPFGLLYLSLLKMCLLPFLVSAIMTSLGRLLRNHTAASSLKRLLAVFVTGLLLCSLVGVAAGFILRPGGNLDASAKATLGAMVDTSPYAADLEISLSAPLTPPAAEPGFEKLVKQLVPENIFNALAGGENLKVLLFTIIFGAAVGFSTRDKNDSFSATLETVYHACQRVIAWVNSVLPFALCALVASQIAQVGIEPIFAMVNFILAFSASVLCVLFLASLVIWWRVRHRMGYWRSLVALREPVLIAAGTRSSIACIPSVIQSMTEEMGFDRAIVELVAPLGITLCRYGPTLYYAVAAIFVAELYDLPMNPAAYLVVFAGALLAGLSSAGTSGILTITLLGVVLEPLGLPLEAALVLFITIDPLVDILRTVTIVYPNCAAVAAICTEEVRQGEGDAQETAAAHAA